MESTRAEISRVARRAKIQNKRLSLDSQSIISRTESMPGNYNDHQILYGFEGRHNNTGQYWTVNVWVNKITRNILNTQTALKVHQIQNLRPN